MYDIKNSKGSRILLLIVIFAVVITIVVSLYRYLIKKDFLLYIKAPCDPTVDECFIQECDEGDVRCSEDGNLFYKIMYKKQNKIPLCEFGNCPQLECDVDEESCLVVYCSDDALEEFDLSDKCSTL